jgi:alginate export protein
MSKLRGLIRVALSLMASIASAAHGQPAPSTSPVSVTVYDRTRIDAWQWFAAPPQSETYGYVESLLRIGVAQRIRHVDWSLELAQPAVLGLPNDAVSPITAQGQLGLGGTYYAANANSNPAAAFLKQGFVRYHFSSKADHDSTARIGRVEFIEGQEIQSKDSTISWLQTNRIAHRLIGNFGFSNAQRSFDGIDGHYSSRNFDVTAMAGRADQGVFNMNGNPELNVDVQYLAFSQTLLKQHVLWRAFGVGYHDGRTGLAKTDNRALAVRATDHTNIRVGSYGGDFLATIPAGSGRLDFLFWGVLQNGRWGALSHNANAVAIEGGYQPTKSPWSPWLRAGWFRGSGDNNATDGKHGTFFQVLPTPRIYARTPFYNLMNNTDEFVQMNEKPTSKLALRADMHWLQLTSPGDLWYQGGGAFDNKVFGYTGRPSGGSSSFASVADISADWQVSKPISVNLYYAHTWGKTIVQKIYPTNAGANYGYVEFVYKWGVNQRSLAK